MRNISDNLLSWYDCHHRLLPWRVAPSYLLNGEKPEPYRVWLSEIMLQQTTVEAVKSYFEKFVKKWPDIFALAKADQEEILKAWAGLGYYSRARNLKACAVKITTDYNGIFPHSVDQLKKLPGIGDYTSAAIAAIAFNQPVAVVDGNVERVVSRIYTITMPLPKAKVEIKKRTQAITPVKRPGDFAQAMMDLGASICTPRDPSCMICPIEMACGAKKQGQAEKYPVKVPKMPRPERVGVAFIAIDKNDRIYLEKRHTSGLLGGMTQIPNCFSADKRYSVADAPFGANWQFSGQAHHVFTHFSLTLDVYLAKNVERKDAGNGWWCPVDALQEEALPTVMKKAIKVAIPDSFKTSQK